MGQVGNLPPIDNRRSEASGILPIPDSPHAASTVCSIGETSLTTAAAVSSDEH